MKRILAMILGLAMVFAFLPMIGWTAERTSVDAPDQGEIIVDESYVGFGDVDVNSALPEEEVAEEPEKSISDPGKLKASGVDAGSYSYKITPLLLPFNEYFFVETDNPDPSSFRFADKSSIYGDNSVISVSGNIYADVKYEDEQTGRVDGGYIFYSGDTDGGEVTLQITENPNSSNPSWTDTTKKMNLPVLKDDVDYLIDTYANKSSFFDNMSAVQTGFSSICLYSGSFIRGELVKTDEYWFAVTAGHIDQSFYIYSPYNRKDNRSLFASAIYPYRYDSVGFPSMMSAVAKRLDSSATYQWNSSEHDLIDVTYNGETRTYGGSGNGKGQGVSEDKILLYYTFGAGGTDITLDGVHTLLNNYASIEMQDDIPRDDALTWKDMYNTVGDGSWARLSGTHSKTNGKWNLGSVEYAYFYQYGDRDGDVFDSSEFGVGYQNYWGGNLGYARDVWVDGRYVGEWRVFEQGATFEDHPTSGILLKNVTVPQIKCSYQYALNPETNKYEKVYEVGDITEETKTVVFKYKDGIWIASGIIFNNFCANAETIIELGERGQIDEKYVDMVTITEDEIPGLHLDRNTKAVPDKGYIYDGIYPPGTPFDESVAHCWGLASVTKEPGCETAGERTTTCFVCGEKETETISALGHQWGKVTYKAPKDLSEVTASRTCERDTTHVQSETVKTSSVVTVEPTCEGKGEIVYRASFENPDFKPVKKTMPLDALGHTWNEGEITTYPTAEAEGVRTFTCGNCGTIRTEPVPKDIDTITPAEETVDEATVDEQIPVIDTGKIKTVGNLKKEQMKIKFPIDDAVDNYRIQYRLAGKNDWMNAWSAGTDTYIIKGLEQSSLCEFRIAGYMKQTDGKWVRAAWSDVAYRYMNSSPLKSAKAGKKKITVTWTKDKKASGYQVQYSLKSNMSNAAIITIEGKATTKCTIKKLKKGKKYFVKVRPVKTKSGNTYLGILSKAMKVKVK
ncbi:MAG: fibronectin type III domain-containing protein [Firmicutes bacterium]|nr:fibronectin type III domain-containing protein [Bacillota bacterium]